MTTRIELGLAAGVPALMDLEELLATRLLVQGNSGSGKSHLLRRLLEESAGLVQQVVVDPEGDFVTLSDAFGHLSLEAAEYSLEEIARIGARVRAQRASVVLNLEGLDIEGQMRCAAAFLGALFEAPREHWYPALVVVDEAQLFAPAVAGEVSDEARRLSLGAMTNLMCRGRKRGLAGIVATQRLAKLAKNVAAEASNFLMGRTFLDIDMIRAADLLGMERRQAEAIRDLERGEFLALGPAVSKRPVNIRIGAVRTAGKGGSPKLLPLPAAGSAALSDLLAAEDGEAPAARPQSVEPLPARAPVSPAPSAAPDLPALDPEEARRIAADLLEEVAEAAAPGQPIAAAFQDFAVRCRMRGVAAPADLAAFRRDFALARAGLRGAEGWEEALALAEALPEEMLAPFLSLARAAREEAPCPSDETLARLYGTSSTSRARWMLSAMEEKGLIVSRVDLSGKRTIALPHLGWRTAPAVADPARPNRLARVAGREAARGTAPARR